MGLLCSSIVACISANKGHFSVLGEDFVTVLSKEHGGQVDLLFIDTNGVLPLDLDKVIGRIVYFD